MRKFMVKFNGDKCKGCELCISTCPKHLISFSSHINSKGYRPAAIENLDGDGYAVDCIGCCSCAVMCPDGAIEIFEEENA